MDGTTFQGRLLHLIPAKSANEDEVDETKKDGNKNYKQKKADQLKKQAGSSHNWNTLFLGASAVAELMSDQYNVEKRDVLLGNVKVLDSQHFHDLKKWHFSDFNLQEAFSVFVLRCFSY